MACLPRSLNTASQSLLLRVDREWFHRTSIACRIARHVSNAYLAKIANSTRKEEYSQRLAGIDKGRLWPGYIASHKGNHTHYCAAHKASDKEHVLCEEGWRKLRLRPLLINALQVTRRVCTSAFFVFVLFLLGTRAASASHGHPTHVPVVDCTCSLKTLDVDAKISSVGDTALGVAANIIYKLSNGAKKFGKASEAEIIDNIQCTNPRRKFQDDQGHKWQDLNIVAYDGYIDGVYKKVTYTFLEGERMQQACTFSSESLMQTTLNKSSVENGVVREQCETLVEDKGLEKGLQELSSAPYKLMVPLRVVGLRGSVPPIWLKDFMLSQGKRVKLKFESQGGLEEIVSALDTALKKKQVRPQSILAADTVTLGDSWLHAAVSGRLIQPIENAEQYEWFNRLGPKWQAFLRRDKDGRVHPKGLIWGAPYRWGSMVIAYRTDKLSRNNVLGIEDWNDLWRPELTGKIAMVDSSREVVGAVLKSLGASYNTQDFDTDVKGGRLAVKQQFYALQKQVKVFDSVHYLKALQSEDVWVAVGWSNDVIPVAKRMSNVRVIAPKSGTSLWADLWAIPASGSVPSNKIGSRVCGASPLVHQWFDFCLQPAREVSFQQGTFVGASPLRVFEEDSDVLVDGNQRFMDDVSGGGAVEGVHLAADSRASGLAMDTNMIDGMPPKASLEKSEVLEPLSEKALADYEWLFSQAAPQGSLSTKMLEVIKPLFCGSIKQK